VGRRRRPVRLRAEGGVQFSRQRYCSEHHLCYSIALFFGCGGGPARG
jgi:hypothetical protein